MKVLDLNDLAVTSFEPAPAPEPEPGEEEALSHHYYTCGYSCSCPRDCPVPMSWPDPVCKPTV